MLALALLTFLRFPPHLQRKQNEDNEDSSGYQIQRYVHGCSEETLSLNTSYCPRLFEPPAQYKCGLREAATFLLLCVYWRVANTVVGCTPPPTGSLCFRESVSKFKPGCKIYAEYAAGYLEEHFGSTSAFLCRTWLNITPSLLI